MNYAERLLINLIRDTCSYPPGSLERRKGVKQAMANGLQLAIFNSCDGLGLAHELGSLNLPQIIVMSEPVPDLIAQSFLRYFLQSLTTGTPFYLAVRQAREQLQGLEKELPCATWLPIICQNLAQLPPVWTQ